MKTNMKKKKFKIVYSNAEKDVEKIVSERI